MDSIKRKVVSGLRWAEKYAKTDMVYLVQNSFWVNANTVITSIFSFVLSVLFARYVSKDVYGLYQFLISISSVLGALTLVGMNSAVTQAVARGHEGVFQASIKTQARYGFASFAAGSVVSLYYFLQGNHLLSFALLIISFSLPLTNALNTWSAFLSGRKNFRGQFVFNQAVNFLYYAGLIAAIIYKPQTLPIICAAFVTNLVSNFFVYKRIVKKYAPNQNMEAEALDYGKKLSFSSILPMIALNLDNIAIFHLLGPTQLAVYAFASNIPDRLLGLLRPISTIAFPKLAAKHPAEVSKIISKRTFQFLGLSFLCGLIYVVCAPLLFKIFFPQYLTSVTYSQIYMLAVVISTAASLPITSLFATRSKTIFAFNIANPLFNIAVIYGLAYAYGIWGAIFGRIIGNVFQLSLALFYSGKDAAKPPQAA
jgi:O-antigen/teichoic acid export membrane protein